MMVGVRRKIVQVPFEQAIRQKLVDWPYDELKSVSSRGLGEGRTRP